MHAAAVGLHDGAADRQAQAHAGRGGLLAAALKLFKHRLLPAGRQAGAVVVHGDAHGIALQFGGNL